MSMIESFLLLFCFGNLGFLKKFFVVVVLFFGFCFLNILEHSDLTRSLCLLQLIIMKCFTGLVKYFYFKHMGFSGGSVVKNLPAKQEI